MENHELKKLENLAGRELPEAIPTGYEELDSVIKGWIPGTLNLIGARPSGGKTSFALDCASNAALAGIPTLFFSLEMSSKMLIKRIVTKLSGIQSYECTDSEWDEIESKLQLYREAPLYVDDTPEFNIDDFESILRKEIAQYGIRLVFIDYLQLMHGPEGLRKTSREAEVSFIVRRLQTLARELEIPIIMLAQMLRLIPGIKQPSFIGGGDIDTVSDTVLILSTDELLVKKLQGIEENTSLVASFNYLKASFMSFTPRKDERAPGYAQDVHISSGLNHQITLDNYWEGKCNENVWRFLRLLTCNMPPVLFIQGEFGTGKSRLLNVVGNLMKKQNPDKKILYRNASEFAQKYHLAICPDGHLSDFINFYSQVDCLLIDDMQNILGSGAQDAFMRVCTNLLQNDKKLVISSEKSLKELAEKLSPAFLGVLSSAMQLSLESPDEDDISEFLSWEASRKKVSLPEGALESVLEVGTGFNACVGYVRTLFANQLIKTLDD